MNSNIMEIAEKLKNGEIGLKEKLKILEMVLVDQSREDETFITHSVFENLDDLIRKTIHGATIEHLKPRKGLNPFHTFEIHTEEGEGLAYLNMVYFRSPISCYYLVYVEVLEPFRGLGLGTKILKAFSKFVEEKNSIGLLNNIIPPEEPTYDIYTKLGWKNIRDLISESAVNSSENYMIFIPHSIEITQLKEKLMRLLFRISKKRSLIEMHDNEMMVKRTISEFQKVYETLITLFEKELHSGKTDPIMCFLFTKFTTKLLGFRRRISKLLGYTGGESLEQISISEKVKDLPILPYSPWKKKDSKTEVLGEEKMIENLHKDLILNPTLYIESLPLYKRPFISHLAEKIEDIDHYRFKIRDLLQLGFDPTKLREFHLKGIDYIFERVSIPFISAIEKRKELLKRIMEEGLKLKILNSSVNVNLPIVLIIDRGNGYVLRRKLEAIHLEEAIEQLRTVSHLKNMNQLIRIDHLIMNTTNEIKRWLIKRFGSNFREEIEDITFFIPWDIRKNMPILNIDATKVYLEKVWIS